MKKIKELASANTPFFVAIGLFRPHLGLSSPEESWGYFDNDEFDFHKNESYWKNTFSPNLPALIRPNNLETSRYVQQLGTSVGSLASSGVTETNLASDNFMSFFRHGYYAAAKFADGVVKYIVDELDSFNGQTRDNTHIIITSDHGYLLGEYNRVGKWTLMESTTRVPLSIIPSRKLQSLYPALKVGTKVSSPVDQIDVFPTLLDMAGIPDDYQILGPEDKLPGVSLATYFNDPSAYTRSVSISEYEVFRPGRGFAYSLRSKYFRFIGFSSDKTQFLFDYRGGSYYRMVERENIARVKKYDPVTKWFEKLLQKAIRNRDIKAWTLVKNLKPFDHDWPDIRGYVGDI
uniref:Sulfatase N-terminal domain-containing protein n=1 Tax=Aplanochytrium stocchinoi TaxID=215587 RepID=A0A7S3LQQ8_9STRA